MAIVTPNIDPLTNTQSQCFISNTFCSFNLPTNPSFNVKIDDSNYLIWKEQLRHVITMYEILHSCIDGTPLPPSKIIKKIMKTLNQETKEIQVQEGIIENP